MQEIMFLFLFIFDFILSYLFCFVCFFISHITIINNFTMILLHFILFVLFLLQPSGYSSSYDH